MMHVYFGDMSVCGSCRKAVIALALILVSAPSFAATYTWTGGANDGGKWSTPANWGVTSGYPGTTSSDKAQIARDAEIELDVSPTFQELSFPFTSNSVVCINGKGRTITLKNGFSKVSFGSDAVASVVLDNLTIKKSGSTNASTVYKGMSLVLQNGSKFSVSGGYLAANPACSLTIDNSTMEVPYIQCLNGDNYKTVDFFIRGTHPLLKVSSDDGTGSVYTKTGKDLSFYFDIPKGGYVNEASGSGYAPIQVDSTTKKFLAGSASGTKLNFYVAKDSEALTMPGTTTYTLVSATAGSATDKATLNNIVPTEGSKTSATLAWEDETVEGVTTIGKYLKATIDVPKPKGLVIMFD